MKTLYLAGPINGMTDAEAMGWRDTIMRALAGYYDFRDPMARDYRGKEDENVAAIVEGDITDIRASDVVLVFAQRPSWGTAMEVRLAAHELGKPVHVIASSPVSPWLRYHATAIHETIVDAVFALKGAA